jgi:hypothetical protein
MPIGNAIIVHRMAIQFISSVKCILYKSKLSLLSLLSQYTQYSNRKRKSNFEGKDYLEI